VYWELEPFGPQAENLNFGTLASLLYNVNRGKGHPARSPAEMALGDYEMPKKKQTGNELLAAFKNIVKKRFKKKNG
jgi:hypothetical protein